jgi:BirA family biotin operon repressor/biotin-[acetyl-CoA-carboxylase] ligase
MIQPILQWKLEARHLGCRVLVYDSLPSTNNHAATQPDGTIVLAREQTAGRGQFGRMWHSPPGGVWMSVVFTPPGHLRRPVILTAWAAVSVAETVQSLVNRQATIKWPNDILVGGKKLCGVLIEQGQRTVAGIGLNVNQSASDFIAGELPDATSLSSIADTPFSTDDVARSLIQRLDEEYDRILRADITSLERRWRDHLGLVNQRVQLELVNGETYHGVLAEQTFACIHVTSNGSDQTCRPEEVRHLTLSGGA